MAEELTRQEIRALLGALYNFEGAPFKATDYQLDIAHAILNRTHREIRIVACTQIGKTLLMGLLTPVIELERPGTRVRLVAPDYPRAKILNNYTLKHIGDHPVLRSNLPSARAQREKYDKEFTKKRLTWNSGGELQLVSTHKGKDNLLGLGGDVLLIDESPLIDDETYNGGVRRMIAASNDPIVVEIGNPVTINHFYRDIAEAETDPGTLVIRIDYQDAIDAGIYSEDFIEREAKRLGGKDSPMFRMLYGAEFVEEGGTGIPLSALFEAVKKEIDWLDHGDDDEHDKPVKTWYELGVDVARQGVDETVIFPGRTDGERWDFKDPRAWQKSRATEVAHYTREAFKDYVQEAEELEMCTGVNGVKVDDIGIGGGVVDILRHEDLPLFAFRSNAKPTDKEVYKNRKTELAWMLKQKFVNGDIAIPDNPKVLRDLQKLTFGHDKDGRLVLEKPQDKSPDYLDAMLMAMHRKTVVVGGAPAFGG